MSPGRLWPSPFLPLIMAPIDNQQALVAYPITIGWIWMETGKLQDPNLWGIFYFAQRTSVFMGLPLQLILTIPKIILSLQ